MKKSSLLQKMALGITLLLCATTMSAKDIFVASEANGGSWDADAGTQTKPAVLDNAMLNGDEGAEGILADGDKIIVLPGTHILSTPINIDNIAVDIIGYSTIDDIDYSASGNSIIDGGGVTKLFNITNNATVKFAHLTFQNAKTTTGGGSAITVDAATVDVGNCGFINNVAAGGSDTFNAYGGAIRAVSAATVNLWNVTFNGNTGFRGGALAVNGATLKAEYCFFWNNSTVYADVEARGGLFYGSDATLNFNFCDFKGNYSSAGGGVFFLGGTSNTTINHSAIYGNHSGEQYNLETQTGAGDNHGGVFFGGGNRLLIINTTIANNYAKNDAVGGVLAFGGNEFTMINSTVTGNYTYGNIDHCGGFKFTDNTAVNIYNSIIERNYTMADNNWSDVYFVKAETTVTVEGSVVGSSRAANPDNITSTDNSYLSYSYDPLPKADPADDPAGEPNKNVSGITTNGMEKTCFPLQASAVATTIGKPNYLALVNEDDDQYQNSRPMDAATIYAGAVQILESEASTLVKPVLAPENPNYNPYDLNTGIYEISTDGATAIGYYTILGQKLDKEPASGLFIVRYSNGKSIKVVK
ncbi:MAG: right-handed parallel beta-helix repeat-containing protein [Prevotellaceae bacterium]|jgi:hypothetical protein|nr:right-handed parallel beta-helix repeat-containing protein [Prevotellaceae bacterium]